MSYTSTYSTKAFLNSLKGKLIVTFKIITISKDKGRQVGRYTADSRYISNLKDNKQLALNNAFRRAFAEHIVSKKIKLYTGNILSLQTTIISYNVKYKYPKGMGMSVKQVKRKNRFVVVREKGRFKSFEKYERADFETYNEDVAITSINLDNPFS